PLEARAVGIAGLRPGRGIRCRTPPLRRKRRRFFGESTHRRVPVAMWTDHAHRAVAPGRAATCRPQASPLIVPTAAPAVKPEVLTVVLDPHDREPPWRLAT